MSKWPNLDGAKGERFLEDAFDGSRHDRLEHNTCLLRNIFLILFIVSIAGILVFSCCKLGFLTLGAIAFAVITLVTTTRYDTRLFFLRNIKLRNNSPHIGKPERN